MTKQRAIRILREYIENNVQETGDINYIKDCLLSVADEYEIRELGFGWVLDKDDE